MVDRLPELKIISVNVQCITNKITEIELMLEVEHPDILCVTEHWLSKDKLGCIGIGGYALAASYCRDVHAHGGVAIFTKTNLNFTQVSISQIVKEIDFECCVIRIENERSNVFVINIYRSPNGHFDDFIMRLDEVLNKTCNGRGYCILCGDLNINFLARGPHLETLKDIFESFGLHQTLLEPTRIFTNINGTTSSTGIDYLVTDLSRDSYACSLIECGLADHLAYRFEYYKAKTLETNHTTSYVSQRDLSKQNIECLGYLLCHADWTIMYEASCSNIDLIFEKFMNIFYECLNQTCPLTLKKTNNFKQSKNKEWLTDEIIISSNKLRELFWVKRFSNDAKIHEHYKNKRKEHISKIEESKKIYYSNKIALSENKSKCMWNLVNSQRNKVTKSTNKIVLNMGNEVLQNPVDVVDALAKHYSLTACQDVIARYGPWADQDVFCGSGSVHTMYLSPTTAEEVYANLNTLKNKYSCGVDGLSSYLIKSVSGNVAHQLAFVINKSFELATFPTLLKKAIVIPIHKGQDQHNINNYRPISLLNTFSKVIEKIMYIRLISFLNKFKLLDNRQHGFRSNYSTESACLELVQHIYENLDAAKYVVGIFYDMSKAFDSLDPHILINKLFNLGLRGTVLEWLSSYLHFRKLYVKVGEHVSDEYDIGLGVPQGSVLGPLLFLLYINDLPAHIGHGLVTLYADDVCIVVSGDDVGEVYDKIRAVNADFLQWCTRNRLILNDSKTVYVNFFKRRSLLENSTHINDINMAEQVKYLGVFIDQHLKFDAHIDYVCKRLNSAYYLINHMKNTLDLHVLLEIYYALVYSVISYNILVWGAAVNSDRVFICQKRILRMIYNVPPRSTCKMVYKNNKIMTLPSIYIYKAVCYARNNLHLFETNQDNHNYKTRNAAKFRIPRHNTSTFERSPLYLCVQLYNKVPDKIKALTTSKFKNQLKLLLTESCFYSIKEFLT